MNLNEQLIEAMVEVPFKYRHHCWFCGEPANEHFIFPHSKYLVVECIHPKLCIPSCQECRKIAHKIKATNIFSVRYQLKSVFIQRYQKDLAIGLNWTQRELEQSQFEGGNFESFQKSAWFMYEVAKARVNYSGWPLELSGVKISDNLADTEFIFDGVTYPNVEQAIRHYSKVFKLDAHFLTELVYNLTKAKFSRAVNLARINIDATPQEKHELIKQLT